MRAGKSIALLPGFSVAEGAKFGAFIDTDLDDSSPKQVFTGNKTGQTLTTISKLSLTPNPTSGKALATVEIGEKSICSLTLLDNLGNEVITIFKDKELEPGNYQYDIEASNLSSGVYLCILQIGNAMHSEKLVYLK